MIFDWTTFLDRRGISYRRAGPAQLRIDCPWCRDGGSPNLSINLQGRGWCCFVDHRHSGVSPVRLIAALLKCSYEEAASVAGVRYLTSSVLSLTDQVTALMQPSIRHLPAAPKLPIDFRPLHNTPSAAPFIGYLRNRGFRWIDKLTERYGIFYARHGRWRFRIVFTIKCDGHLRAWTGRSIQRDAKIRYLTSRPEDDGTEPIHNYLLFADHLRGGSCLVLCEGPFDALAVNELGRGYDIAATCFFTARPSAMQIEQLFDILPRYRQTFLLLDRGTVHTALDVQGQLAMFGVRVAYLPPHRKDPAEIASAQELRQIFNG